jgi:hypothetical protein
MGTIHSQGVRERYNRNAKEFIDKIQDLSNSTHLTFDQILKVFEVMEMKRANDMYVSNGDAHDEQMSGIADCLDKIAESISELKQSEGTI